jgi:hypothetical protein
LQGIIYEKGKELGVELDNRKSSGEKLNDALLKTERNFILRKFRSERKQIRQFGFLLDSDSEPFKCGLKDQHVIPNMEQDGNSNGFDTSCNGSRTKEDLERDISASSRFVGRQATQRL